MSRSISIYYRMAPEGPATDIDLSGYDALGAQLTSMQFWSIPRLKTIGITRLTVLGYCDPIFFTGWDEVEILAKEITVLRLNLESIEFNSELKARWLAHLIYSYYMLVQTAPEESIPEVMIG